LSVSRDPASRRWALGIDDDEGPLTERLGTDGTLTVLVLIVVLTILTSLEEEFLFRGYIYRALRNRQGVWPAVIARLIAIRLGDRPVQTTSTAGRSAP
jgi:membrane protease YdiL (CAAX protease family)